MKHLFILFLVVTFVSCGEKLITTHYENGNINETYQFVEDSIKHGVYKSFTENGKLIEESIYYKGKLNGQRKIYDNEGNIELEELYENGILNGIYKEFHPNGKLKMQGMYTNNILSGIVKSYYDTGELKEEVLFKNNEENGPFKEFHKNGKIKWEGEFRNGNNEFGLLKEYNEEGTLIKKMMCDDRSICTTTWTINGSHLKKKKS